MIGDINGFPLRREHSMGKLLTAYHFKATDTENLQYNKAKYKRMIFRARLERYFARLIIEQESKTKDMLLDDELDLYLMRKVRSLKKRNQEKIERLSLKNNLNIHTTMYIEFASVVVRCNVFMCSKNHEIEEILAKVDVIAPTGEIINAEISAGYCKECNVYFIFEYDYIRLHNQGVILCQIITQKTFETSNHKHLNTNHIKPESLLHQSGYNVNSTENLTSIQRQEILRRVIDAGLYSKSGLLSFLDWLISRSQNYTKNDMSLAINKWKSDREYIANYKTKEQRAITINNIIR